MNRGIQKYLENNNATIEFNEGKIEVVYNYGEVGKVDTYKNFDNLFDDIKYKQYADNIKLELEISARQVGKTTRLVESMKNHLEHGGICFLYTMNHKMGKIIADRLVEKKNDGVDHFNQPPDNVYINPKNDICLSFYEENNRVRCFYDEFEFLDFNNKVSYTYDGYYCTTPRKLRRFEDYLKYYSKRKNTVLSAMYKDEDSIMFSLLYETNMNFCSFKQKGYHPYYETYSEEQYNLEIKGDIFK